MSIIDEPRPQSSNTNRRTFARGIPFSRLFPMGGRQPAMEGYTFITLDVGDPGHVCIFSISFFLFSKIP